MPLMNKDIQSLMKRVEKLEHVVFGKSTQRRGGKALSSSASEKTDKKYKGAKGGILLLIDEGYFKKKRTAKEVRSALEAKEYNYVIQVVQTALNRASSNKGPLVAFAEGGNKVYVNRK